MEGSFVFASILEVEEWQKVPSDIGAKLESFVNGKFEEFITNKALIETKNHNYEKNLTELRLTNEKLKDDCDSFKSKLEVAANTISEHENRLSTFTAEITKLHQQCNALQTEVAEQRHQRNLAIDERDEHLRMLQRRDGEVERLQADLKTFTQQLESAVNAKCEALAQADEVASMKITLEYKEKRMEQEKSLLNSQMESLTQELNQRTEEILNMRRDNTSRCIQLETKLSEKTQELTVATEQIKSLCDLNNNLITKHEELTQKMQAQKEVDAKMNDAYQYEIEAKTKMANTYKSMYEESQQHAEGLQQALTEVQDLLKTATEQYGELETKHKESELTQQEIISKKNECIEMLKKELETANEIIENSKGGGMQRDMEDLSPSSAASSSKLVKTGLTYTELYSRYVSAYDQLTNKDEECTRLNNYVACIVKEIEEKGPLIKKLRQDYSNTLDANDALKNANDQLLSEIQQLRESNTECKRSEAVVARENERLKKEVADLSRQVVHLLQEVEHSRVGSSSASTDNDMSDSVCSADIITKKLVTFNDISELQATNQKLLALVRELTERQEEVELLDPAAIANLKMKLEDMRESQNELLDERDRQNKMMATLRNQRDMYKNLYTQAVRAAGEEVPMVLERTYATENGESKIHSESEVHDDKMQELEKQIEKLNKQIEMLKEENETYRNEKLANEKILLEQLENMRGEVKELTRLNSKLSSHADLNEEKFKIMHNNIEIYKKQITALEKQNKIYSESIIKHEQAATYLKDETLQSQTKLSKAEVLLGNLQKENALLRDSEQRLLKERESLKRDSHQQNLIKSNIELIKATLERTDAESKIRLESRLDESHRETAALRRRLQEEQDHFRQLSDHLDKQCKAAQKRAEEEKEIADKLRNELAQVREELVIKTTEIEELSKKMKMGLFTVADSSAEVKKLREVEQQLADTQAEVVALKAKLKTSKDAADEYYNVADAAEKQVKEVMEQNELLKQEIEKQKSSIKEWQEKCAELEGELSIQLDDEDIKNSGIRTKSSQLQEELNVKTMDLQTAREQLEAARTENKTLVEHLKAVENKYAREVTLHSVDLQELTSMKEELEKAVSSLKELENEKTQSVEALNQHKIDWEKCEKLFQKEKEELESRFKDMDDQNSLLHDQIQALNTQLSVLQAQTTDQQNQSLGDASFNRSLTEDDVKSSEQLLKIVKYLRQEKDIAVSKADIMEAEHVRLKSQFDVLNKQLEEAKTALEIERQKTEVTVVSAAKHGEVLRKLETLNAITDSNRTLRQERDELLQQITVLRQRAEKLETEVVPLQEKNRDLSVKADQMQSENISLRGECTRWRQRANMLIEKTNRTSPEDWKKLQTERETLAKQLTIERSTTTKLNDDVNNLKQDKTKLEEQLKNLKAQNNQQAEEIAKLKDELTTVQAQVAQLNNTVDQQSAELIKQKEEIRLLTEDTNAKLNAITELKNNLSQVKKIAKKYKIQCEEQLKEIEALKKQKEQSETEQTNTAERQEQQLQEQRSELEEKINQMENTHKDAIEQLAQQVSSSSDQIESYKKEIETLKQTSLEKEERFKNLFKNAKERIVSLQEQNNTLKEELSKQDRPMRTDEQSGEGSSKNAELLEKIATLERERVEIDEERLQEKEKFSIELENLNQRVNQLQRQLGLQQGSKPSTSSASSEKSSTERPTADIKPMAGHSTNTQTQSVRIQPWCSGGEPPLASIRPMSAQLRTVAVLPTSQSPSAVMVPPQQQVHTTGGSIGGSGSIEALSSSSPTSSHTDYAPATSSASPATTLGSGAGSSGPRQAAAVPPTQSSQDADEADDDADEENGPRGQSAPQAQAVALVLPRVEVPSSGPTQELGTSSSSSNTVTTTQAGLKRQRDADTDSCQSDEQSKNQPQSKRTRVQAGTVSDSGLEVEYQVPTSSQRDHDDDNVIVVESDDEGGADEGEGADDDQDDPDTEGYDMEGMEHDNYEDADCQEVEDEEEAGNEVEVIEDSSEVPNQSERSLQEQRDEEDNSEQAQSEAISSGTDGSQEVTRSLSSASPSMAVPTFSRARPIALLPSTRHQQQSHLLLPHSVEDVGDDGIVPSTPTLFAPRRSDGFGEAVSSPHVPTGGRFTFSDTSGISSHHNSSLLGAVVPEQTFDDSSTGRSVPSTPLQSSPQEAIPTVSEEQGSSQMTQSDAEIPSIIVSGDADDNENAGEGSSGECMGPPNIAGTSSDGGQIMEQGEEILEGDDGVSSEGEKVPTTEDGEEEGREAEASPSTNSRKTIRGNSARRSLRTAIPRGSNIQRAPIVWGESSPQRQQALERGRGGSSPNFQARAVGRRARSRMQRPFGRF